MISNWREALNRQGPQDRTRDDYTEAIGGYLDYCRLNHQTVAVASARIFMADVVRQGHITGERLASWKAGLNWFFKKGRAGLVPPPQGAPSLGRADLGRTDWERRLIERIRLLPSRFISIENEFSESTGVRPNHGGTPFFKAFSHSSSSPVPEGSVGAGRSWKVLVGPGRCW
jgi:hypothetical protein